MEGDHIEQPEQQQQQLQQDRSPSTAVLSSLLLNFESLTEQIEPLAFEHKQKILASLKTITDIFGELFNKKVYEGQQALITCYLQRPREVAEGLLEAEGEADEGAEPTEDAELDMDEDFSGFIREQMADVERQHRVELLRQRLEEEEMQNGGDNVDGGGGGGSSCSSSGPQYIKHLILVYLVSITTFIQCKVFLFDVQLYFIIECICLSDLYGDIGILWIAPEPIIIFSIRSMPPLSRFSLSRRFFGTN